MAEKIDIDREIARMPPDLQSVFKQLKKIRHWMQQGLVESTVLVVSCGDVFLATRTCNDEIRLARTIWRDSLAWAGDGASGEEMLEHGVAILRDIVRGDITRESPKWTAEWGLARLALIRIYDDVILSDYIGENPDGNLCRKNGVPVQSSQPINVCIVLSESDDENGSVDFKVYSEKEYMPPLDRINLWVQ